MWILDAAITVKRFFTNETQGDKAEVILNDLIEDPNKFLVPDLFYAELSAVIARKSGGDGAFCAAALDRVYWIGIKTIPTGRDLLVAAIEIASRSDLSVYDGIYLATADLMGARWLTADEKAVKKLAKSRYSLL